MNFFKRNRKINFEKEVLVLCRIALVTDYKILEYGDENTWWDYHSETFWSILPETRILIRSRSDYYYEPDTFWAWTSIRYQKGYKFLKIGEKFVEKTDDIPIQHIENITLTERKLKTKKISLKRIKELENLLNSK